MNYNNSEFLASYGLSRQLPDSDRPEIVFSGRSNVGKSSLLNALLREDRAIVTDIPGTTRDSIEETADIGGVPLRIIDTAGIREATDAVERIGVEKARDYASRAALVLALFDDSQPLTDEDREILSLIEGKQAIVLLNKADLGSVTTERDIRAALSSLPPLPILSISTKDERGFDELTTAITRIAGITETP